MRRPDLKRTCACSASELAAAPARRGAPGCEWRDAVCSACPTPQPRRDACEPSCPSRGSRLSARRALTAVQVASAQASRSEIFARTSSVAHAIGASRWMLAAPVDMPKFRAPNSSKNCVYAWSTHPQGRMRVRARRGRRWLLRRWSGRNSRLARARPDHEASREAPRRRPTRARAPVQRCQSGTRLSGRTRSRTPRAGARVCGRRRGPASATDRASHVWRRSCGQRTRIRRRERQPELDVRSQCAQAYISTMSSRSPSPGPAARGCQIFGAPRPWACHCQATWRRASIAGSAQPPLSAARADSLTGHNLCAHAHRRAKRRTNCVDNDRSRGPLE